MFLHNIQEGPANRSFGLQVAKLAGIPAPVLDAARQKLEELEQGKAGDAGDNAPPPAQVDLFAPTPSHPVVTELEALDVDALSPREALQLLYDLKAKLD